MLYREPKLLKVRAEEGCVKIAPVVSVLYREPKLLKVVALPYRAFDELVSVLYREPKLLKGRRVY